MCSCYFLPALPQLSAPPLLPLILDPLLFFILLPPHLHAFGLGVKVRLIIILYFNNLIIPQGLGLLFCRSLCSMII